MLLFRFLLPKNFLKAPIKKPLTGLVVAGHCRYLNPFGGCVPFVMTHIAKLVICVL